MSVKMNAVNRAREIARDDSIGYDQINRYLNPDTDCSWYVIHCYENAGLNLDCWSTHDMIQDMLQKGFSNVTSLIDLSTGAGLEPGDVLWKQGHTCIYVGNGNICEATCNEFGGITGGAPGDQTGREVYEHGYYNAGWNTVLRYKEGGNKYMFEIGVVEYGTRGDDVRLYQACLRGRGFKGKDGKELELDGICGHNTVFAITEFQKSTNGALVPDGIGGVLTSSVLLYR